jgi:hypothetical protein
MTSAYVSPEIAARFTAAEIVPIVAWLASDLCTANGAVLVAGGGRLRRAVSAETPSVPAADEAGMEPVLAALGAAAGIEHKSALAAFDTLVAEAGLSPAALPRR